MILINKIISISLAKEENQSFEKQDILTLKRIKMRTNGTRIFVNGKQKTA